MRRDGWDEGWEAALVMAARAGDLRAFDALARHYRPGLVLIARQILPTREMAEDAAQDALLAAYSALPRLDDPARFGAWLGAIARNRAARLSRGERRQPVPLESVVLAYVPAIAESLAASETDGKVRCAIANLGPDVRPVVELYYEREWSVREISAFLGVPETTVKWRLHTARMRLRKWLPDLEERE